MRWQLQSKDIPTSLTQLEAILAQNRGLQSQQDLESFYAPEHPMDIPVESVDMSPAQLEVCVATLLDAKVTKKKVVICGDYDADGICASAVLWQILFAGGWNVTPFIPDRQKHGYGLSQAAIDDILALEEPPELVITVDNGIVAHEPTKRLEEAGVKVLITDHHQPEKDAQGNVILPEATSAVYSTKLCGTTVGWMVGRELIRHLKNHERAADFQVAIDHMSLVLEKGLDLCGLATIADQVPLPGANRAFAWHGIATLQKSKRPGLLALLESSNSDQSTIDETTISFRLAPRINAMGRLEHGMDAMRLLCTNNATKARELASTLNQTNVRRQDATFEQFEIAKQQADLQAAEHIIIAHSLDFHEGVIGLIAGRLVEEYGKPAIVMSLNEEGTAKASARSLQGINIVELIREVRHDLLEVGGHPMAAGFGFLLEKQDRVIEQLHELARAQISTEDLVPTVYPECRLPADLLTVESYSLIRQFAPFGQKNPEPIWQIAFDAVESVKKIGANKQHIKLRLFDQSTGTYIDALGWNMAESVSETLNSATPGMSLAIIAALELNSWKGTDMVQLRLIDLQSNGPEV